jgi:hypothetical protein
MQSGTDRFAPARRVPAIWRSTWRANCCGSRTKFSERSDRTERESSEMSWMRTMTKVGSPASGDQVQRSQRDADRHRPINVRSRVISGAWARPSILRVMRPADSRQAPRAGLPDLASKVRGGVNPLGIGVISLQVRSIICKIAASCIIVSVVRRYAEIRGSSKAS